MIDPRTPVLVGVGQVVNHDGGREPLALMEEAARAASSASGLLEKVQLIAVVDAMSQLLNDPGRGLAERIGAPVSASWRTGLGGNGPQALVNEIAPMIAAGEVEVALIAGAESMATVSKLMKAGEAPPWKSSDSGRADRVLDDGKPGASEAEAAGGLYAPIFVYPLFEHALRADSGRSREEHLKAISALWSRFADVAVENPYAWDRSPHSAEEIATVTSSNRKVSDPYRKLHNSHIGVDMGAALLLCSADAARAAGVPRDEWVFPLAGAGAHDHWNVSSRSELHRSPAIRLCGEAVLGHTGVSELGPVDLYSCFPSAVEVAARELGLGLDRPLTVTGGLTFAGGPGNNYSTHGIAAVADACRASPDAVGLSTANGWYLTKHALGLYSCRAPEQPYRTFDVQPAVDALPSVMFAEGYPGPAVVETYTAIYERDGSPGTGVLCARTPAGDRTVVKSTDADVLAELVEGDDPLGRTVQVTAPDGFSFA